MWWWILAACSDGASPATECSPSAVTEAQGDEGTLVELQARLQAEDEGRLLDWGGEDAFGLAAGTVVLDPVAFVGEGTTCVVGEGGDWLQTFATVTVEGTGAPWTPVFTGEGTLQLVPQHELFDSSSLRVELLVALPEDQAAAAAAKVGEELDVAVAEDEVPEEARFKAEFSLDPVTVYATVGFSAEQMAVFGEGGRAVVLAEARTPDGP